MKQKIVIRVQMSSEKRRAKAMGLVASAYGVESVAIEGDGRYRLAVVGDGVDSADLTCLLRRKMGNAELITVEAVASPEATPAPAPTPTPETSTAVAQCPHQWYPGYGYYSWPATVYPHPDSHCYTYTYM